MNPPRLTHLLVSILLFSFSHGWTQTDVTPPDLAGASKVVQVIEIGTVLDLFQSGKEATWPVQHADRWCWAASAEIIMLSYQQTSWKQCIQADDARPGRSWPRTCCDYPYAPACNRTGWPRFEYYGFDYSRTARCGGCVGTERQDVANGQFGFSTTGASRG
jgi:hypothetical protein